MPKYQGLRVCVLGMARSGVAAVQLLVRQGAVVTALDGQPPSKLADAIASLAGLPVTFRLGPEGKTLPEETGLLIISPGVPYRAPIVEQALQRGVPVIGELELAYQNCPSQHIAAITGTNGKTTTTALVHMIFQQMMQGETEAVQAGPTQAEAAQTAQAEQAQAAPQAWAVGNIGCPWSAMVARMSPSDYLAVEVSSFQLETVATFRPRVSAILNLTPDHLDRHGDMQGYAAVKAAIFREQGPGDTLVYNADDDSVAKLAQAAMCAKLPFSRTRQLDEGVFLQAGEPALPQSGEAAYRQPGECISQQSEAPARPTNNPVVPTITVRQKGVTHAIVPLSVLRIPGRHNVENALAAVAIAYAMGVPADIIARGLAAFPGVAHRMEAVAEIRGVAYVNDSKGTNPDSTIKAVEAAERPTVLIAGGYDKKTPFDALARVIAQSNLAHVVLMGATAAQIEAELRDAGYIRFTCAHTLEEAVAVAAAIARPGWQVLFSPACASFDQFRDFEARGDAFKALVQAMKKC